MQSRIPRTFWSCIPMNCEKKIGPIQFSSIISFLSILFLGKHLLRRISFSIHSIFTFFYHVLVLLFYFFPLIFYQSWEQYNNFFFIIISSWPFLKVVSFCFLTIVGNKNKCLKNRYLQRIYIYYVKLFFRIHTYFLSD